MWGTVACESEKWTGSPPTADPTLFQTEVYPVLLRDCGFNACHGDSHRFFQVFGPGRVRIDPMQDPDMPGTALEIEVTYKRALSMLITEQSIEQSPLLTKPLETMRGGAGHKGVDDFGRNVYATPNASGYQTLLKWARTARYAMGQGTVAPIAGGQAPPPIAGATGG